jgi:hypothetical protein
VSSQDAARFVGRLEELARLETLFDDDADANVVFLHGPAGTGKSALMRELARRAAARGWEPLALDARDLAPLGVVLDDALVPAMHSERPLVLLDSWERFTALDAHLRGELLPRLPSSAIVVLGTRRHPGPGWFSGGWEHLVLDMPLRPLSASEADALLIARGVEDRRQRATAADWACGSPLALALAAEAGGVPPDVAPDDGPPGVVDQLLRRLLDAQPEGEERDILAVAALAHETNTELLAAALPDVDAERAFGWLGEHPSAEPLRDGVMLHDLVGRVLRADLRRRSPELERDLRHRIVDELYWRATRGGFLQFTRDLQHLVQDPAIRWGFAWDASGRYRVDSPRGGDFERIAARSGRAALAWLRSAERYFAEVPGRVSIVRDQDDTIAGYGIAVTPANAPAFAADDPIVGPRAEHAQQHIHRGAAVICRQAVDLTHERSSPVTALIGMASVIGSGLENPAAAYLPIASGDVAGHAFSKACGATPVPELALEHEGVWIECHVLDYGPGGVLGHQRATVYRELGLSVPEPRGRGLPFDAVRDALRHYGSPTLLAAGPLAPPHGPPSLRAQAARERIDDAVREAFGPSAHDQRLRRVLVRGYLDRAATHEVAAQELNMSRTAYFRSLREAVEQVAAQLGAGSRESREPAAERRYELARPEAAPHSTGPATSV